MASPDVSPHQSRPLACPSWALRNYQYQREGNFGRTGPESQKPLSLGRKGSSNQSSVGNRGESLLVGLDIEFLFSVYDRWRYLIFHCIDPNTRLDVPPTTILRSEYEVFGDELSAQHRNTLLRRVQQNISHKKKNGPLIIFCETSDLSTVSFEQRENFYKCLSTTKTDTVLFSNFCSSWTKSTILDYMDILPGFLQRLRHINLAQW